MALRNPSLFLYGFQVTTSNNAIDFRAVALETPRQATLTQGYYSLTSLALEIKTRLQALDTLNTYTVSVNRNVSGGTQNRVTISTSGAFFQLLFGTGPRNASSVAPLIGFPGTDQSGFTTYTGVSSAGSTLVPNLLGYNYLSPDFNRKVFGSVNVSASGEKEAIVYNIQKFWQVQFRYIPENTWVTQWVPFLNWSIQQRLLEYTPEITSPNTFFEGTLETTTADGKGLGYMGMEMLPDFPFLYDTGLMKFRQRTSVGQFL